MNRKRKPGSSEGAAPAPRSRHTRSRTEPSSADGAVLSLLSELLIGDNAWTMAEVKRLVAVRDLAELGRWRANGLDDAGAAAGS